MTAIALSSYAGLAAMTLLTLNILIWLVMSVKYNPVRSWDRGRFSTSTASLPIPTSRMRR